jgi:hypothetical protein
MTWKCGGGKFFTIPIKHNYTLVKNQQKVLGTLAMCIERQGLRSINTLHRRAFLNHTNKIGIF